MPCWNCAVMSKIFRRSSCQKASDGTDGAHRWRFPLSAISGPPNAGEVDTGCLGRPDRHRPMSRA
jgi:hypothetical protein